MPATSPVKITYVYPKAKDDECPYDLEGFVRAFRKCAGSGKTFGVSTVPHMSRAVEGKEKHLVRTDVVLSESGPMSATQASNFIAANAPSVFPHIAKFERGTTIKSALTRSNLLEAWDDVTRHVFFCNRGLFKSVDDVKDEFLKSYRLAFNQDVSEIKFNGALFSKIVNRLYPDLDEETNADERGRTKSTLLKNIQERNASVLRQITSPHKAKNGRVSDELIKDSQVDSLVAQAKKFYISVTPASKTKSGESEYQISQISAGQTKPGRLGKLEGSATTKYIEYKYVSGVIYDRTIDASGTSIKTVEAKTSDAQPDANGFGVLTSKAATRAPLTADQLALVKIVREKYGKIGSPVYNFVMGSDQKAYNFALKMKNSGSL